jgi:Glycosyl transferases group 1
MKKLFKKIYTSYKNNQVLVNVCKSSHKKRVLVSYTISPFLYLKNGHTNMQESRVIASVFNSLGFIVDVVNFTNKKTIDYLKYDLIFGFGEPFENSFVDKNLKRIYYATGAHVCHQNYAEIKRVEEVNTKYSSNILPKRLVPWNWSMSTSLSDALIVIGNEWTKSTYDKYTVKQVFPINATALINENSKNIERDIEKTKKSFLWFGSSGLVHKGLDLCLEFFSENKNLTLHICGIMEEDFKVIFKEYLENKNIIYHGFVDVQSQKFINIVAECSFSILPTCSEGQATSLLTSMGAGLIPISTRYSGIDIDIHGHVLTSINLEVIQNTINKVLLLSNDEIMKQSVKVIDYIKASHMLDTYENNLTKTLIKILNDKK